MVPKSDAGPRCYVIEEKYSEEEPIPTEMIQICGNRSKRKQCSKDKKSTRNPLHAIKWYVLEHELLYIGFLVEDESFLLLPSKWKRTVLMRNGFDFVACFE